MNTICAEQNSERELQRLAAMRSLYSAAKTSFAVHAVLSTLVATGLAFWALLCPGVKPFAVLYGIVLTGVEVGWLASSQKKQREQAALIQESFDCELLGLPWQPIKAGKSVDHELIVEHAARYRRKEPGFESLRDWYPVEVCSMPLYLARVVCQRINAWWDAKQRRRYGVLLASVVGALVVGLFVFGLVRGLSVPDLLVTTLGPLLSGIWLAIKQCRENTDAATRLEKLKDHALDFWNRALKGASESDLAADSRALQDEIFDSRKRNVPVFDWLYWRLRDNQESQMRATAAELVRQLETARGSGP
jgi:SMODS-associating 4TM effector domain